MQLRDLVDATAAVAAMLIGHLLFPNIPIATEFPLLLGAISIIASMIAVFFVRLGSGGYIMGALYKGVIISGVLAAMFLAWDQMVLLNGVLSLVAFMNQG